MSQEKRFKLFLDETGDHGLSFVDGNFPIFVLVGCLFSEDEYNKICQKINEFKLEFFKTTEVILHSRDIRKCEGPFQILFDLEVKKKFYEKLNSILGESDFIVIGSGVNKEEHIKRYGRGAKDPYSLSLSFVVERLMFCLDKKRGDSVADIQIEKRGKNEDQQLLNQYNKILDSGTYYVSPDRLKRRIDKFDSAFKKENIIGLQIADLCAYPLARHILNPSEPYPPFDIIKSKIYCNDGGNFDGYGLKVFP
ncbi:MAG: DUF3800 domain-containing protein [Candidatus Pacebacteria bacterium]|nr:DUF3800 domain-containing protein [Candidatus Paceibacterota bacterium]